MISVVLTPAILGPETGAPILCAPGLFWSFQLENLHANKISRRRRCIYFIFFGGGGGVLDIFRPFSVSQHPKIFSLRSGRSSSVIFFLIFGREIWREVWREFCGIFLTHKIKAQKFRGKLRSIFREKFRSTKKIFCAKFVLQTCHPNKICRSIRLFLWEMQDKKSAAKSIVNLSLCAEKSIAKSVTTTRKI